MSQEPPQREPLLSGWMKLLLVVATLSLLIVGVVSFLGTIATGRWLRYAAELRVGGDPLTFEEIEAQRDTISEEQNGARVIEHLADEIDTLRRTGIDKKFRKSLLVFNERAPGTDFFKGIDKSRIGTSRTFLEQHRSSLCALTALRDKPRGRFDQSYGRTPASALFPSHPRHVREASRLLFLEATLRLIDGETDSATDVAILMFHLAGTLHQDPSVIGLLNQRSVEHMAVQIIEYALRVGDLDVETLAKLGDSIRDRLTSSTFKWAILGERAGLVGVCEQLACGNMSLSDLTSLTSPPGIAGPDVIPLAVIRMNQRRMAEVTTWLVDACDDPKAMTAAARRMDAAEPNPRMSSFLVRILLPSVQGAVRVHLGTVAKLQCAYTALAAERFRLDNGQFPVSLDALVPRYLEAVPIDPFSQRPMCLIVNEDGIVIYSVGPDGIDDGGDVATGKRGDRSPDRGFRLLEPHLRRLVILDDTPDSD